MSYPPTPLVGADAQLRQSSILGQAYTWMTAGLLVTSAIASYTASAPLVLNLIYGNPVTIWVLFLAQIGLVIALSAAIDSPLPGSRSRALHCLRGAQWADVVSDLPGLYIHWEGVREVFWLQGMMGGIKGQYDCIKQFSEVDYTEDLKRMNVPTLIVHGDDDQIVPIAASALRLAKIAPQATLKVYPGAPHSLPTAHQDQFNADLLAFIRAGA
jgi:pimeloyl-ACP methyl ester carboxylesterase